MTTVVAGREIPHVDVRVTPGDPFEGVAFRFKDPDGVYIDLAGKEAAAQIRTAPRDGALAVAASDDDDGSVFTVTIEAHDDDEGDVLTLLVPTLTAEQTRALPNRLCWWDVQFDDLTQMSGRVLIGGEVTP